VIWVDLVTPDLAGAKRFYGSLFGWTFRDLSTDESGYTLALLGARPVGGLLQRKLPPGGQRRPGWLTFIAVRDVEQARRFALAHGATLLAEARNYPKRGWQAIFADPQGAVFAVLASSAGDPPDVLAIPGGWIWSSLIARDPDRDAAFYQALFGYELHDVPAQDGRQHFILSSDGYARASANGLPADKPDRPSHWLNFVRVANVADAVAKASSLGGSVLVEPHMDRHGGRIAVLADPQGARFGVMEWSDASAQESAK
jgi:predicted enzyme related to lactoylglutathione lyase